MNKEVYVYPRPRQEGKIIALIRVYLKNYPERLEEFFENPNMTALDLEYLKLALNIRDETKRWR